MTIREGRGRVWIQRRKMKCFMIEENILNKSILHKVWSKTTLSDLHKFMLFHLIENFPFNLPHTFYINIQKNLKGLGGPDDIYYAALINKMLWD